MSNIGIVCPDHAPQKMGLEKTTFDRRALIGLDVKVGVKTDMPANTGRWPTMEHIWIRITAFENGELKGRVNSDPAYIPYKAGDDFTLKIEDIEDIYKEETA